MRRRPQAADRAALIDRLAPFLPAGFYYKTFLWPRWETFEGRDPRHGRPRPRRSGQSPAGRQSADSTRAAIFSSSARAPAGLAAATRRRARGTRGFPHRRPRRDRRPARPSWRRDRGRKTGGTGRSASSRAVEAAGGRVMTRTTAYGVYDGNLVCAWERRAPAARRALAHPAAADRGRGRRDRAAAHRPRQRPARRDVRRRGARLSPPLRASSSASASSSRPTTTAPIRRRGFGRGRRGGRDCRHARRRARKPAARDARRRRSRASSGREASKRCASAGGRAIATPCSSPAAGRRPCIFTPRRAGVCATTRRWPRSSPMGGVEGLDRRRRRQRRLHARRSVARGP